MTCCDRSVSKSVTLIDTDIRSVLRLLSYCLAHACTLAVASLPTVKACCLKHAKKLCRMHGACGTGTASSDKGFVPVTNPITISQKEKHTLVCLPVQLPPSPSPSHSFFSLPPLPLLPCLPLLLLLLPLPLPSLLLLLPRVADLARSRPLPLPLSSTVFAAPSPTPSAASIASFDKCGIEAIRRERPSSTDTIGWYPSSRFAASQEKWRDLAATRMRNTASERGRGDAGGAAAGGKVARQLIWVLARQGQQPYGQ